MTSKTYIDQDLNGPTGRPNGRYYIHAISTEDLSERPNFPVNLEGMVATNNPVRSFNGGIHHQRPGLLHTGNFVYAGFASHWYVPAQEDHDRMNHTHSSRLLQGYI